MYAYTNILAALLQRGQTGKGQRIDISMLESLAEWTSYPLYYAFDGAAAAAAHRRQPRDDLSLRPVPDRRRRQVMLGLQNEREWVSFCDKVLQQPELAKDPRFTGNAKRVAERDALREIIVEAFAAADGAQVVERLEARADRQCAGQHDAGRLGASAAEGARPLARGRLAGGPAARDAAARHLGRGPAHGPGARARRAHRRDPGGARLSARPRSRGLHSCDAV